MRPVCEQEARDLLEDLGLVPDDRERADVLRRRRTDAIDGV